MNHPGSIHFLEYDPDKQRLTIAFDTLRKIVFYKVPVNVAAMLADANTADEAFNLHVLGKFEWTEIGAMPSIDPPVLRHV
jgi:hypothetical protein